MRTSPRLSRAATLLFLVLAASTLAGAQARRFPLDATLPLAPDIKTITIYRGIVPFLAAPFVLILLLLLFPQLALWLPQLLYG